MRRIGGWMSSGMLEREGGIRGRGICRRGGSRRLSRWRRGGLSRRVRWGRSRFLPRIFFFFGWALWDLLLRYIWSLGGKFCEQNQVSF